eukprot:gene10768-2854_t
MEKIITTEAREMKIFMAVSITSSDITEIRRRSKVDINTDNTNTDSSNNNIDINSSHDKSTAHYSHSATNTAYCDNLYNQLPSWSP